MECCSYNKYIHIHMKVHFFGYKFSRSIRVTTYLCLVLILKKLGSTFLRPLYAVYDKLNYNVAF